MNTAWWEITSAAAFGAFVVTWRMRRDLGHLGHGAETTAALLAQALVLWLAGTSLAGTLASFAAGIAVLFASMWLARAWREHRDSSEDGQS